MGDFGFDIAKDLIADFECLWKKRKRFISNTTTVTNSISKLLIVSGLNNKCLSFHSLDQRGRSRSLCSPLEQNLLRSQKVILHSSCNGLLLIQINSFLCVWNPLTRFFQKVLTYKGLHKERDINRHHISAELCFDSSRAEYKVVLVKPSRLYSWRDECFYVARCGAASWKKIKAPYTIDNVHLGTIFEGKKHWICKGRFSHCDVDEDFFFPPDHIVYFNPCLNVFVEIPIPQPKNGDRDKFFGLGVLDGYLCITRLDTTSNDQGNLELLAMKEYGYEDSWVVMFVMSNISQLRCYDIIEPLLITNEGEVLISMYMCDNGLSRDTGSSVKSYDVNGNFLRDLLVSTDDFFEVILYEESMASTIAYHGRDLDYEKHRQFNLWKFADSFEDRFQLRKTKSKKNMEKKHHHMKKKPKHSRKDHCWQTSIDNSTRRKGWNGKKINYESKCAYINFHLQHDLSHENIIEGEAVKIKSRRAPQILYKTSVIGECYTDTTRDSRFYIAEDLLIEVVSRLPLKSLARFMCVSKQWHQLISNVTTIRNTPKILIQSCLGHKCLSFHSLDQDILVESLCSPMEEHLFRVQKVTAYSSCNGYVLIHINDDLVMWNPLTKFFKNVFTWRFSPYDSDCIQVDLCFDNDINEYKIVLVNTVSSYSYFSERFYIAPCGASSWEKFDVPDTVENVYQGPSVNGYKHWISKGRSSPFHEVMAQRNHIVYFDPSTNDFIEVPMPQPKKGDNDTIVGLGVLEEHLCMTRWDDPLSCKGSIEFLSMKEYGKGESWEIMFVVSDVPKLRSYDTMRPLLKTKEGEVLVHMYVEDKHSVKVYDVDGNFLRDVLASKRYSYPFDLIPYEESWFLPIKSLAGLMFLCSSVG